MAKKGINEKIDDIQTTLSDIKTQIALIQQTNEEYKETQTQCRQRFTNDEKDISDFKGSMKVATGIMIGLSIVATLIGILAGAKAFGLW